MIDLHIVTEGYKFVVADNTICLPSAANTQNEASGPVTAVNRDDSEDAILIASGLLPRLIAQARKEAAR